MHLVYPIERKHYDSFQLLAVIIIKIIIILIHSWRNFPFFINQYISSKKSKIFLLCKTGWNIIQLFKKKEIMPFAATWMDLEIIIWSELRERQTNIIWYHLYVRSLKNELIYKTEIVLETQKWTYNYQRRKEKGQISSLRLTYTHC